MRVTAYHDGNGNIVGLSASAADDSIPAEIAANEQPTLHAVDVELPSDVALDPSNPRLVYEGLAKLKKDYRVDKATGALSRRS